MAARFSPLHWWRTRRVENTVRAVAVLEPSLQAESDDALRRRSAALRFRARGGEPTGALVVEAFALVREACRRTVQLRHYDVQIAAGAALCAGTIVEMQTGEGKTLTAALPLFVYGLYGRGACLATSNDYLARRDAEYLRPAFQLLGLSVDAVTAEAKPDERHRAYRCDVTYGTGKEFGFDFLRDRLRSVDGGEPVQRKPFFMLVDEADNVLVDDAGTPLVIAAPPRPANTVTAARFRTAAEYAVHFIEATHYLYDEKKKRVELTAAGRALVRTLPTSHELQRIGWPTLYEDAERALLARRNFHNHRQYVVCNGEVHIVDEFTGRIAEGRKWRDGLHQAVEAQERLEITDDGGQAARVTVQDFFRRYPHLAGMTGTAADSSREFRGVYRLPTFIVPTNRPSQRTALPACIFATAETKWRGVVDEVVQRRNERRPVLVGTRSIDQSQRLSDLLRAAGVEHFVLNAREIAREAEIVARAGRAGRVTVATNMAGRGTDVKLDAEAARHGGLHVVLTEMHEAARIDRQLIGRGARQGDPGSYRYFLSLEDDLLVEAFGAEPAARIARSAPTDAATLAKRWSLFRRAQRVVERRNYGRRKQLLYFEKQRNRDAAALGLDPYLDFSG